MPSRAMGQPGKSAPRVIGATGDAKTMRAAAAAQAMRKRDLGKIMMGISLVRRSA